MFLKFLKYGFLALFVTLLSIFLIDLWVKKSTRTQIFTSVEETPKNKVGLLLGTRKMLTNHHVNLYYSYRIDAAEQLFKSGKIEYILISGDNSREEYDEPTDMKNDLIARGIPEANAIFGQEQFTVISQPFHNERAIFISEKKGFKTIGFNAKDVSSRYGWKVQMREKLARVKMLLDIVVGKQPKFYGEKIEIT